MDTKDILLIRYKVRLCYSFSYAVRETSIQKDNDRKNIYTYDEKMQV